jgi:hypothetical protein
MRLHLFCLDHMAAHSYQFHVEICFVFDSTWQLGSKPNFVGAVVCRNRRSQ